MNEERKEVAAVRNIYDRKELEAVLCITLDYDKIFQAFDNITEDETGGMIVDPKGNILYQDVALPDIQSESARPGEALEAVKKSAHGQKVPAEKQLEVLSFPVKGFYFRGSVQTFSGRNSSDLYLWCDYFVLGTFFPDYLPENRRADCQYGSGESWQPAGCGIQ